MSLRACSNPVFSLLIVVATSAGAHDAFLPLHEHRPGAHSHGSHGASHETGAHQHAQSADGKHVHLDEAHAASRWVVATGVQYTRYSVAGSRAELWETGLGFEFAVLPWLHAG